MPTKKPITEPMSVPRHASPNRISAFVMLAKLTSTLDMEDLPREAFIVHSISEMP